MNCFVYYVCDRSIKDACFYSRGSLREWRQLFQKIFEVGSVAFSFIYSLFIFSWLFVFIYLYFLILLSQYNWGSHFRYFTITCISYNSLLQSLIRQQNLSFIFLIKWWSRQRRLSTFCSCFSENSLKCLGIARAIQNHWNFRVSQGWKCSSSSSQGFRILFVINSCLA